MDTQGRKGSRGVPTKPGTSWPQSQKGNNAQRSQIPLTPEENFLEEDTEIVLIFCYFNTPTNSVHSHRLNVRQEKNKKPSDVVQ